MGSGFAFKKRKAASSVRDPNTHAADGVPILPGLSRFEMTPTIDLEAVTTSGKSKHTKSSQTSSIVFACKRQKEVRNVKLGARSSCTGWSLSPSWTQYFRDDIDDRFGGCRYAWKIESKLAPSYSISGCRVCFKETESSSQCQGNRQRCSGWSEEENPEWTLPFRDDTDNRGGGCAYYWYLDCQPPKWGETLNCPRDRPC